MQVSVKDISNALHFLEVESADTLDLVVRHTRIIPYLRMKLKEALGQPDRYVGNTMVYNNRIIHLKALSDGVKGYFIGGRPEDDSLVPIDGVKHAEVLKTHMEVLKQAGLPVQECYVEVLEGVLRSEGLEPYGFVQVLDSDRHQGLFKTV